ncbi:histidine kinase [Pseudomaricurvus alkylphenolicus]|uniref:sensor histidine kinase n=1 Tax=Pseudomaricurvus alkylphenolicus TaxID=1306991 RepID=UPI001421AE5A|nr:ATP-binding protein [Pseudomaricurvus alkylphenolicus]NIB40239.1 histidine kinase [Pseudomaricurvus alkylphenolicus]
MVEQYEDTNYPLLRIYAYYRTGLSSVLLAMFHSRITSNILGHSDPELFSATSAAYTLFSLLALVSLWRKRFIPTHEQIFVLLFIDILALLLMIHASEGLDSSLGFLLLITAAVGGIFLNTQVSTALAAISTLLILGESLYRINYSNADPSVLFVAGTLGILLFAMSLTFNYLSTKLRLSAAEAQVQAQHAAHLQQLAQLIIERMQTGVVVSNPSGEVELINRSARKLLDWPKSKKRHLQDLPELADHVQLWQAYPHTRTPNLKIGTDEVRLRFAQLAPEGEERSEVLTFVEDHRALTLEAQHLKLASLGRLTASIAHEIRNPLGAISHAGQLLAESPELNRADRRLTEIIETNAQRVNQIIENVLQLSRRRPTKPELLKLNEWLEQFVRDYLEHYVDKHGGEPVTTPHIELRLSEKTVCARIDSSHLSQVLTNLADNGLRYSEKTIGAANIQLHCDTDPDSELPYVEVIDEGDGIAEDSLAHVFEPFYTTEASGSGLGLYLSKEMCEANHASLHYRRNEAGKSCFRIDFAHPDRIF